MSLDDLNFDDLDSEEKRMALIKGIMEELGNTFEDSLKDVSKRETAKAISPQDKQATRILQEAIDLAFEDKTGDLK